MITLFALLAALSASAPDWSLQENRDGVLLEARDVPGSAFEEIRVTTLSRATPGRVCDAVWGGAQRPLESGFKERKVIRETEEERWIYERVGAPMVRDRDYTIHFRRAAGPGSGCRVTFETQNDQGPPPQDGAVRIPAIRGSWDVDATAEGATRIVYLVYSDPGGRIPASLARGGQRSSALSWIKTILGRASETSPAAGKPDR